MAPDSAKHNSVLSPIIACNPLVIAPRTNSRDGGRSLNCPVPHPQTLAPAGTPLIRRLRPQAACGVPCGLLHATVDAHCSFARCERPCRIINGRSF